MNSKKYLKLIVFVWFIAACNEMKDNVDDAKSSYLKAKEAYDDGYYELAMPKLKEFKARFPYSNYALEAELLIADAYFQQGDFAQSAAVYEQFVKLHSTHSKADFALYRMGLCFWKEAPDESDREQEFTEKAIEIFESIPQKYPKSKYLNEVKELIVLGERRLAEADLFVASFYCKTEKWGACALRSVKLVGDHGEYKDLMKQGAILGAKAFASLATGLENGTIKKDANLFTQRMSIAKLKSKAQELRVIAEKI